MLFKHLHSKQDHKNISFAIKPKITVPISRSKNCSAKKFHEIRDLKVSSRHALEKLSPSRNR